MLFAEAVTDLATYQQLVDSLNVPVLANMTEFGKTPYFSRDEFAQVGVGLVLYPLSAFRAMSRAAAHVYQTIRAQGSQQSLLQQMQTRDELYDLLDYEAYEAQADDFFRIKDK